MDWYQVGFLGLCILVGLTWRHPYTLNLERAELLDTIATGAAARVVAEHPTLEFDGQLYETEQAIVAAPAAPTHNGRAIARAATVALLEQRAKAKRAALAEKLGGFASKLPAFMDRTLGG